MLCPEIILWYFQVDISELVIGSQDSGALPRIVGPAKDFVRGSINNRPFRPGGLDNTDSLGKIHPDGACNGEWARGLLRGESAQIRPPGFKDGLDLGELKVMHSRTQFVENTINSYFFHLSTKLTQRQYFYHS